MSPIPQQLVRFTQRIKNVQVRKMTLGLIEVATQQSDLAMFTNATLKNPSHTSNTDPRPHVTVLLATDDQQALDRSQAVHIYHDGDGNYAGHVLFPERQNKTSDD
ncbi:hypothetical protein F5B22DRAFT_631875 [Xylaria bambusicola]|uniref:uncharacterized protein n=1 Tax=Xylaria bambusicola TaxID=326684 RepID=UPI0020073449|nr:uncharacterized protein F5B22DRAFT_631875 [Xylaria bambusicola]KAI0502816.1 hypothetical protein F5B22DRAFT_631875 [Xylaria bambusicola]